MKPYKDPTTSYELGPQTALTPSLVAHGSQSNFRILKGNPVGHVIDNYGKAQAYASARTEHFHQPFEHAMLDSVDVDSYRLGQSVPSRVNMHENYLKPDPSSIFAWPDTSVSGAYNNPNLAYEGMSEGMEFGPGQAYRAPKV